MSQILRRVAPIGEARDREILKDAATYVYQERPEGQVHAHLFFPKTPAPIKPPYPVIVFFHGGFWDSPMPTQFVPHCLHFAHRGMVAIAVETRCTNRHGTGPLEAIEDSREFLRWLQHNADIFNIDPTKLVIGGASGGALLALLTAMPKLKRDASTEEQECRPKALVLFSALVNTVSKSQAQSRFPDVKMAKLFSPSSLIRRKLPPMMFFHGTNDRIAPFEDVSKFCRKMRFWGNNCQLVDFKSEDHSFFNFNVSHTLFEMTIAAADHFIVDQGLLPPAETQEFL